MTKFLLVLIIYSHQAIMTQTIIFDDEQACRNAGAEIALKAKPDLSRIEWSCVFK